MPVLDGIDIPVLEWCSIAEAVLWLEHGQEPIDPDYEKAFSGRVPTFSLELGMGPFFVGRPETDHRPVLGRLFVHGCLGELRFRGKPAKGPITFTPGGTPAYRAEWGDYVEISKARLKQSKSDLFVLAAKSGFLSNGLIFVEEATLPKEYILSNVEINFSDLKKYFPFVSRAGSDSKSGGTEPTSPSPSRPKGGRPPKYNWEHAAIATLVELYAGRIKEDQQNLLTKFMTNWFTSRSEEPDQSSVREKIRYILSVIRENS